MRMLCTLCKTHSFFVFPHSPWRILRTPCSAPCGPCSSPGPPSSCRCRPSGPSPTPGRAGDVRRRWPRGSAAGSSPARAGSPRRSCRWGCCSAPPSDCSPANEGVTTEFKIHHCLCTKIMQRRDAYRQRWSPWGSNGLRTPIIARVVDVHILLQRGRFRVMIGKRNI